MLIVTCNAFSWQINAAAEVIYEAVDPNANIIFGALVDPTMTGEIAITVIATGTSHWCWLIVLRGRHWSGS
jgi:cell division GTPase FtsZ